jgi:hypothetical protein
MALWSADLDDGQGTEPENGCHYGIFREDPAVIASKLPRPKAPFVPYGDFPSKARALKCVAMPFPGFDASRFAWHGCVTAPPCAEATSC